jgi:tRNA pseudouridine38-40 synthase
LQETTGGLLLHKEEVAGEEKNIKAVLEYDGTDFSGWQVQPGLRTVQGVLEDAVFDLTGTRICVNGAGRTDAGVHATGQVASFGLVSSLDAPTIKNALNSRLPRDVLIVDACEEKPDFHARFSAVSRQYVYRIGTRPSVLRQRYRWELSYRLDLQAMSSACRELLGRKDFRCFTTDDYDQSVCDVKEASITAKEDEIRLNIEADRFLRKMVRSIAGTLVEIGRGRLEWSGIGKMIASTDRESAGPTAPAKGLCLVRVNYAGTSEGKELK